MSYSKKEFKKLKDEWYKKLKDSGFEDIEHDEDNLKTWALELSRRTNTDKTVVFEAKMTYYSMARNFLNDYQFNNEVDKKVWADHTEGISIEKITRSINESKLTKTNRQYVWLIICRLRALMQSMYIGKTLEDTDDKQ